MVARWVFGCSSRAQARSGRWSADCSRRQGIASPSSAASAHLRAIAADGLAIEGLWGEHRIRGLELATSVEEVAGPFDAVLLTVKAFDTAAMLAATAGVARADGCVISLQNGLGNIEQVAATVGAERALGGRVIFGAAVPEPGRALVTVFADPIALGAAVAGNAAAEARAREWTERLAAAGVPTELTTVPPGPLCGRRSSTMRR